RAAPAGFAATKFRAGIWSPAPPGARRHNEAAKPKRDVASAKAEPKAAAAAVGGSDAREELRRRYDRLTHSQKRIAEYIIAHSHAVAFSTVDQMAARLNVNPSTIVRFTYRLG